jgi:hypothetical protein
MTRSLPASAVTAAIVVVFGLVACEGPRDESKSDDEAAPGAFGQEYIGLDDLGLHQQLPFDSIWFSRSGCGINWCPTYDLVIRRDGSATFKGEHGVEMLGEWHSGVGTGVLLQIGRFLTRTDLAAYPFPDSGAVEVVDGWEFTLSVFAEGESEPNIHTGVDDVAPTDLWIFCNALDGIVASLDWERAVPGG